MLCYRQPMTAHTPLTDNWLINAHFLVTPINCYEEGKMKLSLPIVLALVEGLANVAGTEDFSEPAPLFILRVGI